MTFGEADEKSFMHKVSADQKTSFAIMNRALEAGINFIDTADVYGQDGLSERVIGAWFAEHDRRDDVVLATKFRFTMGDGPNRSGGQRYRIVKTVEESLRRMGTDRIDLYQIHMQDITTPEEETLRALDDLISAGKILYIGCSNYAAYRMSESWWLSELHHWNKFVTLQAQYSLITRDLEREHVPFCRSKGMGILPWSPLAGGFLSGKYHQGQAAPEGTRLEKWQDRYARYDNPRNWRIIGAVREVAAETGATCAQVSLAWLIHKPVVSAVIFGARTVDQVTDNAAAAELSLSPEQMTRLDEASAFDVGYPYDFMSRIQGRW